MQLFQKWLGQRRTTNRRSNRKSNRRRFSQSLEVLERREMMAADVNPVLMVVADQQDFYYQEYGDTRASLEAQGLEVVVAATTTETATPHANSGQGADGGFVTPDLALTDVEAEDYSGIVFVGGWGSSSYQYAFEGTYSEPSYNGDSRVKLSVNQLINDFVDDDKPVAAICHGVTVLAWARVDGASPLDGKSVAIPYIGSPAVLYEGRSFEDFELSQYEQVIANGAQANKLSGQIGDPTTVADDVIVDGRIITAENYDSAAMFGVQIAKEILATNRTSDDNVIAPSNVLVITQPELNGNGNAAAGTIDADDLQSEGGENDSSPISVGLNIQFAAAETENDTEESDSAAVSETEEMDRALTDLTDDADFGLIDLLV